MYFLINKVASLGICSLNKGGWHTFDNGTVRIRRGNEYNTAAFQKRNKLFLRNFHK